MRTRTIAKSLYKIFINSNKDLHLFNFCVAVIAYCAICYFGVIIRVEQMETTLNGVAIISAFFLLTLSNMDFAYLNENFTKNIKISRNKEIPESTHIRASIFSLAISTITLVAVCFVLNLIEVNILFFIIWLLLYLFVGIIYTLILWNFFASKKSEE